MPCYPYCVGQRKEKQQRKREYATREQQLGCEYAEQERKRQREYANENNNGGVNMN